LLDQAVDKKCSPITFEKGIMELLKQYKLHFSPYTPYIINHPTEEMTQFPELFEFARYILIPEHNAIEPCLLYFAHLPENDEHRLHTKNVSHTELLGHIISRNVRYGREYSFVSRQELYDACWNELKPAGMN